MLKKIIIGICVSCLSNMIYEASNNCYAMNEPYKANAVINQEDQQAQEIATLLSKYFAYTAEQISAKGMADACIQDEKSKALVKHLDESKKEQIVGFIVDGPVKIEKEALNTFDKKFIRVFTLGNGLCAIHALGAQLTKGSPVLDINRASDRLTAIYYSARLLNAHNIYREIVGERFRGYETFVKGLPFFEELIGAIAKEGKSPEILDDDARKNIDVMLKNLDLIYKNLEESNDLSEKISNFFKSNNKSITPEDQSKILHTIEELSRLSKNFQDSRECWADLALEISEKIDSYYVHDQTKRDLCNAVVLGINNVSYILDEVDENKMLTGGALQWPDISATMPVYDDFPQKSNKKLALFWGDANVGDLKISPYAWNMFPLGSGPVDLSDPTADYVIHEASHFSRVIPRKLFEKVKEKLRNMGIDVYVMNDNGDEIKNN